MNSAIISIENIYKSYQDHKVLDNLNWQIERGDIVALLGKNGAGKSTLLESIMNLRDIDSGELKLWEKSWKNLPQSQRGKIAYVAQDTVGFEWMRVHVFLSYLGGFFPSWDEQYCNDLSHKWGLDSNKKVGDLSGGQTQILHVIQALSVKPELLILDEPVAHLDPNMRRQFISELVDLACESSITVVFSSHIISDLERVANKVALLKNGQIEISHEVEELKASIAHLKIAAGGPLEQSEYYAELANWQSHSQGATATVVKPMSESLESFINNAPNKIEHTKISLEDWYLEVCNEGR